MASSFHAGGSGPCKIGTVCRKLLGCSLQHPYFSIKKWRLTQKNDEKRIKIGTKTRDSSLPCSEQLDQARVSRHRGRVFSITARKGGTCTMKGADRFMPWTSNIQWDDVGCVAFIGYIYIYIQSNIPFIELDVWHFVHFVSMASGGVTVKEFAENPSPSHPQKWQHNSSCSLVASQKEVPLSKISCLCNFHQIGIKPASKSPLQGSATTFLCISQISFASSIV